MKIFLHRFIKLLDDEKTSKYAIPLLSITLSMIIASLIVLSLGKSPVDAFAGFLRGSGFLPRPAYAGGQNQITDFLTFLGILAPMLLASLGIIVAMKAGLFNIGVAGQMLAAGFTATVFVGYSNLDAFIARPLVILVGMLVGGAIGGLIGFLKYRFNIHEVVSSIMLNHIISNVTGFLINTYYADPISRSSRVCSAASRLTVTGLQFGTIKPTIPIGIILAIAGVFAVQFFLDRTVAGFELKAVGKNRDCASYAGIKVGRTIVSSMMISGLFAGLAGVTYYMGYFNAIVPRDLASLGYDAIAVSLLGSIHPIGAIFSATIVSIFQRGSVYMSSNLGVPKEIASVIIGIMLLFSACGVFMRYLANKRLMRIQESEATSDVEGVKA